MNLEDFDRYICDWVDNPELRNDIDADPIRILMDLIALKENPLGFDVTLEDAYDALGLPIEYFKIADGLLDKFTVNYNEE